MQSEWKVTSNRINGETMYAVFRIRNTSEVDHSGNREYAGQWTANKQVAIEIAKALNTDSKKEEIMKGLIFLDKQHTTRMLDLLKETNKISEKTGNIDIEYGTAYYLLSSYKDIHNKAKKYIKQDGIHFKNMLTKQDFSSGEEIIVKLAANLFNWTYKEDVSPIDIIGSVDDDLFKVALSAIILRRSGSLNISMLVNEMVNRS